MKSQYRHYGLPLSLLALLWALASQATQGPSKYAIDWSASGGSSGMSTGGVYSVCRTVGCADSERMHSAGYTVAASFWSGTVVLPEFATSGFYVGMDFHDPGQALADFNGDGLSNLMKYALGINLRNGVDAARSLVLSVSSNAGSQFLTMQFKRRTNAAAVGLHYLPEISTDGQTWFSDSVLEVDSIALDTQFDWVTVRDQTPTSPVTPRFFRLRVVQD